MSCVVRFSSLISCFFVLPFQLADSEILLAFPCSFSLVKLAVAFVGFVFSSADFFQLCFVQSSLI